MTRSLSAPEAKWLTYLVYLILVFLTVFSGWLGREYVELRKELPKDYVQRFEYLRDQEQTRQEMMGILLRIEKKMDDHIEKWPSKK